jgi:hypothetical protein
MTGRNKGSIPDLKPRCALKVAVAGNRRFAREPADAPTEAARRMKAEAARACALVWDALAVSLRDALETEVTPVAGHSGSHGAPLLASRLKEFFRDEPPQLTVLSGLAAGADQIGAETALALGETQPGIEVHLDAVLPFSAQYYPGPTEDPRPEFRPEEARGLESLAARARQVVRLDGRYGDDRDRHHAYRQSRDMLLQHADMLVAIYDPRAVGAAAGTLETVGVALAAAQPVVAILVADDEARLAVYTTSADRRTGEDAWLQAHPLASLAWRAELASQVRGLLALPGQLPATGETELEREHRLGFLAETVHRLWILFGRDRPHILCRLPALGSVFRAAWTGMLRTGAFFARPHEFREHTRPPDAATDEIVTPPYASAYLRASELSAAYMTTYRGAFVLSFTLAGVAVASAVLLMAVTIWSGGHPPAIAIAVLGGLKVAIIIVLLLLERVSHQARYQEHATDFRYLAELIRPMQWLAPAGTTVQAVELPAHSAPVDPRRGWTPWLLRAVSRSTPCVAALSTESGQDAPREVTLDRGRAGLVLERARDEWVQGQLRYHTAHAQRMHAIDDGLERLAKGLLWLVLGCAIIAVVLELLPKWGPEQWANGATRLHPLAIGLGAVAAAVPAFIAALGGIMFQSEARRLKLRSEAMYHGLAAEMKELDARIAGLTGEGHEPGTAWSSAQHLRALSGLMLEETGDWKVLYETHEVHAG